MKVLKFPANNERGFFTIVGLCLLLAVAISIRGVQEFEGNYSVGVSNSLAEHELQNAADSALIKMIETGKYEKSIMSDRLGKISINIKTTQSNIRRFRREYESGGKTKDIALNEDNSDDTGKNASEPDDTPEWLKIKADCLISIASCENKKFGGTIYRCSQAYIIKGDDTVYFLTDL
ncbi:MAG: hypothetical protein J5809_00070 [Selenomonadaceae bacterium]|nr:hypothetical protein [Selenomonadaceae bacterium]